MFADDTNLVLSHESNDTFFASMNVERGLNVVQVKQIVSQCW